MILITKCGICRKVVKTEISSDTKRPRKLLILCSEKCKTLWKKWSELNDNGEICIDLELWRELALKELNI